MHSHILSLQIVDFPVAVRQALCPQLRARPVVVVSSRRPLGRVLACSSMARSLGIEVGMQFAWAKQICPDAVFLLPDREQEARADRALAIAANAFSPRLERYGPGRLFLDIRGTARLFGVPLDLAARYACTVRTQYNLDSALGLSVCKTWSHLAGCVAAPGGILEILDGRERDFLMLVPPEWLEGVGPRTCELLRALNITRLGQLRPYSRDELVAVFGAPGLRLYRALCGADSEVQGAADQGEGHPLRLVGSRIDVSHPLREETADPDRIYSELDQAAAAVGRQLRAQGREAGRLQLLILYSDGRSARAHARLIPPSNLDSRLYQAARAALERAWTRRVRLAQLFLRGEALGFPAWQRELFVDPRVEQERRRLCALDAIHARFGEHAVVSATRLQTRAS